MEMKASFIAVPFQQRQTDKPGQMFRCQALIYTCRRYCRAQSEPFLNADRKREKGLPDVSVHLFDGKSEYIQNIWRVRIIPTQALKRLFLLLLLLFLFLF